MVNYCRKTRFGGKKIMQLSDVEGKKDLQLVINRYRASGLTPSEFLKESTGRG